MLRFHFLQQWYGLADEALEDPVYDSQAMRAFFGINLARDPMPDATTLLRFSHLLEKHDHCATIINAPSSTKNKDRACAPEMHQIKKGNQWYFGMKAQWKIPPGAFVGR